MTDKCSTTQVGMIIMNIILFDMKYSVNDTKLLCFPYPFVCFYLIERWVFYFRVGAKHRKNLEWPNNIYE
jgi:hypothetical protein